MVTFRLPTGCSSETLISLRNRSRSPPGAEAAVGQRQRHDQVRIELTHDLGRHGRAELRTDPQADDIHVAHLTDGVLVQLVPHIAEVGGVDTVKLVDEGRAHPARCALLVVAERADAGHHDVVDLVLTRRIEHERLLQARRQRDAQLPGSDRRLGLAAPARLDRLIGIAIRDDVGSETATRGTSDGPEWVCGDDPFTSLETNA